MPRSRLPFLAAVGLLALTALLAVGGLARAGDPPSSPPSPPDPGAPPSPPAPPASPPPPAAKPAPPVAAAEAPRIAFDRETHDFATAKQNAELHTEFTIRNDGTAPLHIKSVHADCGCATATPAARVLAPGASTPLTVTMRTFTMFGTIHKRVLVESDDPARPTVELRITVEVAAGIVLDPARFYFDMVLVGTAPSSTVTLKWKDGVGRPFKLISTECPGAADLKFETTPYEAPPWHGVTVKATFTKPPPIGTVSATALLRTDDPDYPRIASTVTAFVTGKIWVNSRATSVGMVPYGRGRTLEVGARGWTRDTELGEVKARARKGRVTARAIPDASNPGPGSNGKGWLVEITLPAEAEPGRVEDVVEVTSSSLPNEPPAEISVVGQVLDKPR